QAVIGAGRPFTHRDLQGLLGWLAEQPARPTVRFLPPTVLAHGEDFTAWWQPARIAPMWFLLQGQRYGFRVPWPPLLFLAVRHTLYCAALAQADRPDAETPLFHAPLMNIDAQGAVCLGTAEVPPDHAIHRCSEWEAAVYATNFSHVSHAQTLQIKGEQTVNSEQHFQFWQALHGRKRFPSTALAPMHRTLQGWLEARLA
ncbi:MAG: PRTRC system protein B, partial [Candidatus Competibacteraceae bacterium]|nr:PRTRC system protein B [Candidatus Competibacteraceae bacterium]